METIDYHNRIKKERDMLREENKDLKERLAKAEAERDAAQDNARLMNEAASRHLRRAEQAEAQLLKRLEVSN